MESRNNGLHTRGENVAIFAEQTHKHHSNLHMRVLPLCRVVHKPHDIHVPCLLRGVPEWFCDDLAQEKMHITECEAGGGWGAGSEYPAECQRQ